MIQWHAVMARGPKDQEELCSFQGQPIVFNLEDPEHDRLLGDMRNRGLVHIGCDLVGMGVEEYLALLAAGEQPDAPAERTDELERERERIRAERLAQMRSWLQGDQALTECFALVTDVGDVVGRSRLLQFQGIPVLFSPATSPRDKEEMRRIIIRQPDYRPVRWGMITTALPANEWWALMQEGAQPWRRV
jgi:hypothetical protein